MFYRCVKKTTFEIFLSTYLMLNIVQVEISFSFSFSLFLLNVTLTLVSHVAMSNIITRNDNAISTYDVLVKTNLR